MRILLYADGGPRVGAGHAMRCLALAEAAVAAGHRVWLTGPLEPGEWEPRARAAGASLVPADAAREIAPDLLHLDSYRDAPGLVEEARGSRAVLSSIRDGRWGARACDVGIDPSPGAERAGVAEGSGGSADLRGLAFAPLRDRVVRRRSMWAGHEGPRTRVLVVMGGTDAGGRLAGVIEALAARNDVAVTAIAPPGHSLPPAPEVDLRPPVEDLPALMLDHDLLVTASGTTVWEACCVGIPLALVCAADNQRPAYDFLVGNDLATALDDGAGGLDPGAIGPVLADATTRSARAVRASEAVDGLGAWRVVRAWEQELLRRSPRSLDSAPIRVRLRPVTLEDADTLLRWRNDPATREASRRPGAVAAEEHREWLHGALGDPDRILLLGEDERGPVGVLRWDAAPGGSWEVSLTVAPERRGAGLSGALLAAGEEALREHAGEAPLLATVNDENLASRRLFAAAGYLPDLPPDDHGFARYRRPLS